MRPVARCLLGAPVVVGLVAALVLGCGPAPAPAKSSPCQCAPKASAALAPRAAG